MSQISKPSCSACNNMIQYEALQCLYCSLYVDLACIEGCNKQAYKYFQKAKNFMCVDCQKNKIPKAKELYDTINNMQGALESLNDKIDQLKDAHKLESRI